VTKAMMAGFYVTTAVGVAIGALPWPVALVALGLPTLAKVWGPLGEPKPDEPPAGFPIWPLWYAAFTFVHTRRAGLWLVLGLLVAAVAGIEPRFLS
jgi:1,4-dihydroxy-2-naphthoate octaprenyltransferase